MPRKKKVKKKVISKKPKETVYKTKKEWISKATVNKSQYIKKYNCLLYTSPSPRDSSKSRMPSSA